MVNARSAVNTTVIYNIKRLRLLWAASYRLASAAATAACKNVSLARSYSVGYWLAPRDVSEAADKMCGELDPEEVSALQRRSTLHVVCL